MADKVVHNEAEGTYELAADGGTALVAYNREGDILSFTHTEVPDEMEGQGMGKKLIGGALDDVRARGLKVEPLCSFVRHYMETHPDTRDLLA